MKPKVDRSLKEVWAMKAAAHEQTKHLSGVAYFNFIHERVARMFPDLRYRDARSLAGIRKAPVCAAVIPRVAESHAQYGKRSKRV